MEQSAKSSEITESHPEKKSLRRHSYRPAIIVVALLLVTGVGVFAFAMINRDKNNQVSSTDNQPATVSTTETTEEKNESVSQDTQTEEPKEEEIVEDKSPVNQDGVDPNTLEELTGVVNYAAVNDDTLMIRVLINQYLNSGTCDLTLYSASVNDTFSLTDNISPSASTSSCSFDISTNLLTGGKYDITVSLSSGNKKGTIKGEVDV